MAIAHQTDVQGAVNAVAGNYDTNITPAAAPSGVCVIIVQTGAVTDVVTSVTYGTGAGLVALSRGASPHGFVTIAAEAGAVYYYWAGDSAVFPSGTQTVRIARTGTTSIRAVISTMTVAAGQQVVLDSAASLSQQTATANPSWTHTTLAANTQGYEGIHSGLQTMTNTPRTSPVSWTLQGVAEDFGATGRGWARTTSVFAGPGALSPGWTAATAEDFVGVSVAFKEAAPPPPPAGPPILVMAPPLRR